jgi:hypothetical protein
MGEALNRAREALADAQSDGRPVPETPSFFGPPNPEPLDSPLDEETLDEQASTQMGRWEERRRPTYRGD